MNISSLGRAPASVYADRPTSASQAAALADASAGGMAAVPMQQGPTGQPKAGANTSPTYAARGISSFKEAEEAGYRVSLYHRQIPMSDANTALDIVEERLGKVQQRLDVLRPDIDPASWDLSFADGQLKVTGSLPDEDQAWLEQQLNGDETLKNATQAYVNAAVSYLQTSDDNPAYHAINGFSHSVRAYDFKDVAQQFGEAASFKDILGTLERHYTTPNGVLNPGAYRGADSLEYLASRLESG